ncbi:hypothetical protein D3C80_1378400 [compost metagenome]
MPEDAPSPSFNLATASSDDDEARPEKLDAVFSLAIAARKVSSALLMVPMADSEVVAVVVWVLICFCFGAFSALANAATISSIFRPEPRPVMVELAIFTLHFGDRRKTDENASVRL